MHAYQWDSKLGHDYMGPYLPDTRHEYVVDSSQFHVDLEAEVGEGLWWGSDHILHLYTLCRHSQ